MTRKFSAFGTMTAAEADDADYITIVDASAADATKNKRILVSQAKILLSATALQLAGGELTGPLTLADDPSDAMDAATKQYVDGLALNLGKRQTVRVTTTANIVIATALNSGDTLDGITLATNDLVLVKNQSTPAQNGVYVVDVSPTRSTEFDTYDEHPGSLIAVQEGTAGADTIWLCTSNAGGTLNTTPIVFSQSSTSGGGGYSAGSGLNLTGKTFSVNTSVIATVASPALTGNPTAPTPSPGDNDTSIATTGFVKAAIDAVLNGVSSAFDTLAEIATELALKATLASPTFTGTPVAPTAAPGTNTTQIATTAFVDAAVGAGVSDPELLALAGLTSGADKGIQFTGSGTAATYDLTTAGKALLDDASAAAQRTTLGLSAGGILAVIDGGGSTITTGMKGYLGPMPFGGTITEATLIGNASGSIVVDIWKCTYSQFDAGATHPVAGDKITASAPPTITTATKSQDSTLTGWTTAFSAGDILAFNVNSVTTMQRVDLSLKFTK